MKMQQNKKVNTKLHTKTGIPIQKTQKTDRGTKNATTADAAEGAGRKQPKTPSCQSSMENMEVTQSSLKRSRSLAGSEREVSPKPKEKRMEECLEVTNSLQVTEYAYSHMGTVKRAINNKENPESGIESLDALMEVICQLTAKCANLEGKIDYQKTVQKIQKKAHEQAQEPSYASMATKLATPKVQARQAKIRAPQSIVFMRPKDTTLIKSAEEAKAVLLSSFNPQKEKVQIKNLKKTRLGLMIETNCEEDLKKIENNKDLLAKFVTERLKKKPPRVIIYDVPKDMTETEVGETIFEQNAGLSQTKKAFLDSLQLKFKTGKKDESTVNWVAEVTPDLRQILIDRKKVYIGWLACKIQDYVLVTRCYKCQGYGHIAKYCHNDETCSHCAKTGHVRNDCPNKNEPKSCANCKRVNKEHKHDTLDKKCPLHRQALERLINITDYGL